MARLEEKIDNENKLAKIEMLDFAQDMKRYQKDVTDRGYPFWHKHPSKMQRCQACAQSALEVTERVPRLSSQCIPKSCLS